MAAQRKAKVHVTANLTDQRTVEVHVDCGDVSDSGTIGGFFRRVVDDPALECFAPRRSQTKGWVIILTPPDGNRPTKALGVLREVIVQELPHMHAELGEYVWSTGRKIAV